MLNITTETSRNAEENGKAGKGKKQKRSLKRYLLEKMQIWINGLLEAERDEFLGRGRHAKLDEKHDNYRNGYRPRTINFFGLGRIQLRVPRDRKGEFESAWLPERKGQDPELESFLAEVFLAGCSTRDLARVTEKHLGQKYDSKQISRIVARASTDLEAWRTRRLEGRKYKFLYIDGANFAVRINRRVSRQSFCAVLGVSEEGECFEVLALEMGDREHTDLWENVFRGLLERGLNKEGVELGIMDGLPGLEGVFKRFFPRSQTQRCQKHAKANACRQVRKTEREEFSKDLNKVFYAANEAAARTAFFAVKDRWGNLFPSAVGRIEKDLDSLLTFFQFDATYWTVLRTTNPIERLNKEFKRRTRAMEVTGGEISTYRCLAYVAQTMEYRWSFHPLSQWASVYTQNAA
ncbi:MAG: IS256 family transposase [Acidobacteriota bacterium]|nr:IS256 family transposase [Acidobacteriota bacterium]